MTAPGALPPPRIARRALLTERLRLEPLAPRHYAGMRQEIEASLPELRVWLPWPEAPPESTAVFIRAAVRDWRRGAGYTFAMVHEGRLAGTIGLRREYHDASMGYWITTGLAGRGLVTEAGRRLARFGFEEVGFTRLELRAGAANRASCRVAVKIGFRWEGFAPDAAHTARENYDCYFYGLPRARWTARQGGVDVEGEGEAAVEAGADGAPVRVPDFSRGPVTVVVQDAADGALLMVAHMDAEAWRRTRETGQAWFWSRSRSQLWEKGATSGNRLEVLSTAVDCDGDSVLLRVRASGPACHTGARSCFDPAPG